MAVTELRIHGVSGTAPERVLNHPILARVAGDQQTGFYAPRIRLADDETPPGVRREAYSWGYLTAGAAARALWLLLVPFTLANLAIWARPSIADDNAPRRVRFAERATEALCRIFCLTLTLTLLLAAAGATMDLAAWQCAGTSCGARHWFLGPFQDGALARPGMRVAAGAIGPIATLVVLWILGRSTWQRYERQDALVVTSVGAGLAASGFWRSGALVGRLRSIHIAAGFATIASVVALPAWQADVGSGRQWAGVVILVVAGTVGGLAVVALCVPVVVRRDDVAPMWTSALRLLRWIALATLAVALGYASIDRPGWQSQGSLPGYLEIATVVFFAQVAMLVLLTLAVTPLVRGPDAGTAAARAPFAGYATPIFATLGFFVGGAFSAGVIFQVAERLGQGVLAEADRLRVPLSFEWAAFAVPFVLVGFVGLLAHIRWRVIPRLIRTARRRVDADFPGLRARDPATATRVEHAIGEASVTDQAARLATVAMVPLAIVSVGAVTLAIVHDVTPAAVVSRGAGADVLGQLTASGIWLVSAAAAGLVALGVQAYRTPGLRRMVGILWDVATFWPRGGHPLAPPCYAERAVPELVLRAQWHTQRTGVRGGPDAANGETEASGVVLSGHSQGSVLAAAVVLQLPAEHLSRTALLTYGSPLFRLYARYFPAFFGPEVLATVAERLDGRWRNLWRATDPIGGPVQVTGVDRRLRDPVTAEQLPGDPAPPAIGAHSDYDRDPAFAAAVAQLRDRLTTPSSANAPVPHPRPTPR